MLNWLFKRQEWKRQTLEVERLLVGLKDSNEDVRHGAVVTLGKTGALLEGAALRARVVESLIVALKDENNSVRYLAATALGEIVPRLGLRHAALRGRVVESLILVLEDVVARPPAVKALDLLGVPPAQRVPARRQTPSAAKGLGADDQIVRRVAYLVGYLRQFRRNATVDHQPEYEELRRIGHELDAKGGMELMRQVAHRMAPLVAAAPNPYVRDQVADSLGDINDYWKEIGGWQA